VPIEDPRPPRMGTAHQGRTVSRVSWVRRGSTFGRNMLVARVDTRRLLDRVARSGPDAFEAFCDCYDARVKWTEHS
jgi:hypothetical protein